MREIRRQEQAEKMKGREIALAISEAVAATRAQCYKTFSVRKVRIFATSYSVCPWQVFTAWSAVCKQGWSLAK